MRPKRRLLPLSRVFLAAVVFLVCGLINGFVPITAAADDTLQSRQLVERARMTVETFMQAPETVGFRRLVANARGIFVAPQVLRGAFILGGSGGSGVFLVWDAKTNSWAGPAFYTVGGISFGFQIGGDASEVVFLAMTERGVNALLSSGVKLGADVSVAVGPVGAGVDASTANVSADILTFTRSKGLYGGISLAGAVVYVREDWNNAYYGRRVTPTDILILKTVSNPHAIPFIAAVSRASDAKAPESPARSETPYRTGGSLRSDNPTPRSDTPSRSETPLLRPEVPVDVEDISEGKR